jgi:ABC-2 type transport system ATP-binding protein
MNSSSGHNPPACDDPAGDTAARGHGGRFAVDIRSLRVDYGDFVAVDDLTLAVPRGEILGIVGPNGAGKTSTFRVLATLMEPTHGDVFLDGVDIAEDTRRARRLMGYMPDLAPVPSDLKVWEFLDFYAAAYGLRDARVRRRRADRCLETVGLSNLRNNGCRELSRGQTQRVVLAKTLLHGPRVLILDEPASGLDPLARRDLRTALQTLAATGATILISSHILGELSEMCTSLCILDRGRLLAHGSVNEVRAQLGNTQRRLTLGLLSPPSEAADWLARQPTIGELRIEATRISFEFTGDDDAQAALLEELVRRKVRLKAFEERRPSLEELLVDIATPPSLP